MQGSHAVRDRPAFLLYLKPTPPAIISANHTTLCKQRGEDGATVESPEVLSFKAERNIRRARSVQTHRLGYPVVCLSDGRGHLCALAREHVKNEDPFQVEVLKLSDIVFQSPCRPRTTLIRRSLIMFHDSWLWRGHYLWWCQLGSCCM